ncbi:hypothetical protein ABZ806_27735 [Spirillospora sp. NPDC047418]
MLDGHRRHCAGLAAEADADRDARVTFEEYAQRFFGADSYGRYIKPLAESVAALGDVDDDGKISQPEFVALLAAVGFNAADYAAYFQTLDTDGDNAITVDRGPDSAASLWHHGDLLVAGALSSAHVGRLGDP